MSPSRRDFLASISALVAFRATALAGGRSDVPPSSRFRGPFCFFSKHLPMIEGAALADAVKGIGFDGIDLTVRPGGHVAPERVRADLPRALDAIRGRGVDVPMVTTALLSADEPTAAAILETAGKHGVRYFKPGYYRYALSDVRAEVAAVGRSLAGLARLGETCGVELGFHNHEGNVGASLWDIAPEIDKLPAKWAGYYFDARHAVVEGGGIGWKAAARLTASRLKMIAVKDVFWEKGDRGWRLHDCPLGEGMVDWTWYSKALADAAFHGPVSFHFEYEIDGATPDSKRDRTLEAAARDLAFMRDRFAKAYGTP
jgi:L-ribulose-5-phosphate 3-epimerase